MNINLGGKQIYGSARKESKFTKYLEMELF